jgi:phospholipase C
MRKALVLLVVTIAACSQDDGGPRSMMTADQAATMRQQCAFSAGTLPGLSQAKDATLGSQIPIDTVVIVMMENRSFDHLLGHLPATGQTDVDVADDNASQPDNNGQPVKWFHQTEPCFADTNHGWDAVHRQLNGGKMDGFVITNSPPYDNEDPASDGVRAMGYYDSTDLPWLYGLANAYSINDRYFSGILGPTFPNREYLYAATSYGMTFNKVFTSGMNRSIINLIEDNNAAAGNQKVSWMTYNETIPNLAIFLETLSMYLDNVAKIDNFYADAAAGNLPNVSFVDPNTRDEFGGGDDFHPPGTPQLADQFLAKVVDAVTHSPQWGHLALFITFDEHGGLYDHVAPPPACAPDDIAPILGGGGTSYDFANYGFRVPLFVVSPYSKAHHVSHVVADHTSILRFVESRFKLPAMTKRDANADPLFDMFDFTNPALKTPAPLPPVEQIDQATLDACAMKFPNHPVDFGVGGAPGSPTDGGM